MNLGHTPEYQVIGINKADQHIVSVSQHYSTWILTGDIKLAAECQSLGIHTRLAWDIIMAASMTDGQDPPLNYIMRMAGLEKSQGSMFARVVTGPWAGMRDVGIFTVCDVELVGSLLYDTKGDDWVFRILDDEIRIKCQIIPNREWIICGSYKFSDPAKPGSATIRVAHSGSLESKTNNINLKKNISTMTPGEMSFGHSVKQEHYWNGWLKSLVISPQAMTKETWRSVLSIPFAAPNPYSGNILEAALRMINLNHSVIQIPSEVELRRFWI